MALVTIAVTFLIVPVNFMFIVIIDVFEVSKVS